MIRRRTHTREFKERQLASTSATAVKRRQRELRMNWAFTSKISAGGLGKARKEKKII
jgi:hypothetical protein